MNHIVNKKYRARPLGILAVACLIAAPPVAADGTVACNVNAGFPNSTTECGINAIASGEFSTATGSNTNATGLRSTSYGRISDALADDATALGHNADALAIASIAVGQGAIVTVGATNGTAIGRNALVTDPGGTSVGAESDAQGIGATAVGGDGNDGGLVGAQAIGINATAIGSDTMALGTNSTAIGNGAFVEQPNAMVLGSGNVDVGIGTSEPMSALHIKRGDGTAVILVEEANVVQGPRDLFEISNNGNPEFRMTNIGNNNSWLFSAGLRFVVKNNAGDWVSRIAANGDMEISGVLTELSDVNAKQDIEPVDGRSILNKLESLEISEWSYKDAPTDRHVGPMAQDFKAAFGLGNTDKGIATLDSSGIALAAIKALILENEALKQRIVQLEEQGNRVSKLEAIVDLLVSEGNMRVVGN